MYEAAQGLIDFYNKLAALIVPRQGRTGSPVRSFRLSHPESVRLTELGPAADQLLLHLSRHPHSFTSPLQGKEDEERHSLELQALDCALALDLVPLNRTVPPTPIYIPMLPPHSLLRSRWTRSATPLSCRPWTVPWQ